MALIYKNPYLQPLRAAEEELRQLESHMALWEQRRAQLVATIAALSPLAQDDPAHVAQMGLTEACRTVLIESRGKIMTAPEVRGLLALRGIDISGYRNPMAVLHSTLGRIARVTKAPNGETGYQIIALDGAAIRKLAGR